jgi:tetratricopeptide (TPR) repeat protein
VLHFGGSMLDEPKKLLRWLFFVSGLALLYFQRLYLRSLGGADLLQSLQQLSPALQVQVMLLVLIVVGACTVLCFVTAWGMKRRRRWSRWTGICASLFLLPGFPLFSIAGGLGLFGILLVDLDLEPAGVRLKGEAWDRRRESLLQQFVVAAGWILIVFLFARFTKYAQGIGLAFERLGWNWWLYVSVCSLVNTAVHELGHAAMAWGLHYQIRVISIGPFIFADKGEGFRFRIEWKRILDLGGYMGAVADSEHRLRVKEIAVIAAGPATSFLLGQILLAVFALLPGTPWQASWELVALGTAIAFSSVVVNLVPVGYSDGGMLFHLICNTRAGKQLLDRVLLQKLNAQAAQNHDRADFATEVAERTITLRKMQQGGERNRLAIALCHQSLGHARLACNDWPGAELEFRKCLEFEAECAATPALRANAWSGLHQACTARFHTAESSRVYERAVEVLNQRKKERDLAGLTVTRTMLAQTHRRARNFNDSLAESAAALESAPRARGQLLLRAMLHSVQAKAALGLGWVDSAMRASAQALEIVRSGEIPPADQNLGWDEVADLGAAFAQAGLLAKGLELIEEAIGKIEAAGITPTAALYRAKMATILRIDGKLDDAWAVLPQDTSFALAIRRIVLTERAELHLAAERPAQAIADCEELIELWSSEEGAEPERASSRALLAAACLENGDHARAEAVAREAAAGLCPMQHPNAIGCRITEFLARCHLAEGPDDGCVEGAIAVAQAQSLLTSSEIARIVELQIARMDRHGHSNEAGPLRRVVQHQTRLAAMQIVPAFSAAASS